MQIERSHYTSQESEERLNRVPPQPEDSTLRVTLGQVSFSRGVCGEPAGRQPSPPWRSAARAPDDCREVARSAQRPPPTFSPFLPLPFPPLSEARIESALTILGSSLFVTIEHELPLEVISENLRLVNKST